MEDNKLLGTDLKYVVVYQCSPQVKEVSNYRIRTETKLQITIRIEENGFRFEDVYAEQNYNNISDSIGTPKLYSVLYINHNEGTVKYHSELVNDITRSLANKLNDDKNYIIKTQEIIYLLKEYEAYINDLYTSCKSSDMEFVFINFIKDLFQTYQQSKIRNVERIKIITTGESFKSQIFMVCMDQEFKNNIRMKQVLVSLRLGVEDINYYNRSINNIFAKAVKNIRLMEEEIKYRYENCSGILRGRLGNSLYNLNIKNNQYFLDAWTSKETNSSLKYIVIPLEWMKIVNGLSEADEIRFVEIIKKIENNLKADLYYLSTCQKGDKALSTTRSYCISSLARHEKSFDNWPYELDFDPENKLELTESLMKDLKFKQEYGINAKSITDTQNYEAVYLRERGYKQEYIDAFLRFVKVTVDQIATVSIEEDFNCINKLIENTELLSDYLIGLMKFSGTLRVFQKSQLNNMELGKVLLGEDYLFFTRGELLSKLDVINRKFIEKSFTSDESKLFEAYETLLEQFAQSDASSWCKEKFTKCFLNEIFYDNNKVVDFTEESFQDLSQLLYLRELLIEKRKYLQDGEKEKEILEKLEFLEKDVLAYSNNACTGVLAGAREAELLQALQNYAIECTRLSDKYKVITDGNSQNHSKSEKTGFLAGLFGKRKSVEVVKSEETVLDSVQGQSEELAYQLKDISRNMIEMCRLLEAEVE